MYMQWLKTLSNGFWGDLAVHILAAILLIIAGHLIFQLAHAIGRFRQLRHSFSLAGSWIATCKLPSYPSKVEAVEIYRLVVKHDRIDFCFFNYRPDVPTVRKYVGAGACRGHLLSVFYYIPARHSVESGVFIARLVGHTLKGLYAQYDARADEELYVSPENFTLKRVRLDFSQQLRLVLGKKPVKGHAEALRLYTTTNKIAGGQEKAIAV